jgi:XTP/dITP diphosphohydrolase
MRWVVATGNAGKARELALLLGGRATLVTARELGVSLPDLAAAETGASYAENAWLKARALARVVPEAFVLADDSGLEVRALAWGPGVHSAHFAGPNADDRANVAKLCRALRGISRTGRAAVFRAVLCLLAPDGRALFGAGHVAGYVVTEPRGTDGFGYDPVFCPEGETATVAELGAAWKAAHSHRARAARALLARFDAELGVSLK